MKKLILAVAIVASGVSTFALSNNIINNNEAVVVVVNEKFTEIAVDKLPTAITDAVAKDFASATISKAYVNSSEQYMLTLSVEGSESTVYADKEGNWIEEADVVK
ncbi:hypothetical protein APS56_11000 [Pseudalgibacter alginicilyticus]|uniref:Beta-lactamase-inhibitor-like PepSY-like domain-containing protein n=1 Tax=Pseudalgibacter alginicilyticus TaxID=1736674 RepID=A0A0P0D3S8_9FLAO|nr:hypothetical protein [Pseudalgibacter alginicilyticus]ALJ05621.1 hypothetical protein APS56_11000 [Pseudalgibacter alginicilyticus]